MNSFDNQRINGLWINIFLLDEFEKMSFSLNYGIDSAST